MRAVFDGCDYTVVVDRQANDFELLTQGPLCTILKEILTTEVKTASILQLELPFADLPTPGKTLKLILDERAHESSDGIQIEYLPAGAEGWQEIAAVYIYIARRAFKTLQQQGTTGTRYGMGNKITITTMEQFWF